MPCVTGKSDASSLPPGVSATDRRELDVRRGPPQPVWPLFLIEPVGTWPNPIMCGDRRIEWLAAHGSVTEPLEEVTGNSQHHRGVLEHDAPLAAGVNASLRRASPDVDPGASSARVFVQDADGSNQERSTEKGS